MRLNPQVVMFPHERPAHIEHRVARGERKTRRHGIEQTSAAMKPSNQFRAVAVCAVDRLQQR